MKLKFILPGRVKESYLKEAFGDYITRLKAFATVEFLIFDGEITYKKEPTEAMIQEGLDLEAEKMLKLISNKDYLIVADLHGEMLDSQEFAERLEKAKQLSGSFIILVGSSYGISIKIRERADILLCLSKLTTTHFLAMLLMMEQIYRANKILANHPYHK